MSVWQEDSKLWNLWPYFPQSLVGYLLFSYKCRRKIKCILIKIYECLIWEKIHEAFEIHLLPYKEKNCMHNYDTHLAVFLNCEINGPCVRISDPAWANMVTYWKCVKYLRKSSLLPYIFEKNLMHSYIDCPFNPLHKLWNSRSLGQRFRSYGGAMMFIWWKYVESWKIVFSTPVHIWEN